MPIYCWRANHISNYFTCSKHCFDGFDWNLQSCNLFMTCDGNDRCNIDISVATPSTSTIGRSSFMVNSNWMKSTRTSLRNSSKSGMTTTSVGPFSLSNFSSYHDRRTWILYWERRRLLLHWLVVSSFCNDGTGSVNFYLLIGHTTQTSLSAICCPIKPNTMVLMADFNVKLLRPCITVTAASSLISSESVSKKW